MAVKSSKLEVKKTTAKAATARLFFLSASNGEVFSANPDGSGKATLLTGATDPSWSADATRIAFVDAFGVPVAEVIEVSVKSGGGIRIEKVWVAAAVGRVVDPVNFENLVQGGVIWGLGHAMNCELTYADGAVQQSNYHQHEGMRMFQCPPIEVRALEQGPVRGIGEPPVPPAAPALANAIFAATGRRLREMPFKKFVDFV